MARGLALACLLLLAPAAARADGFIAGTEDVPLMPGLVAIAGHALIFDKPEGRIVEAEAHGRLARKTVRAFYATSLSQLGWQGSGRDAWRRDGERLHLAFSGRDGALIVDFTLSPQQEPRP